MCVFGLQLYVVCGSSSPSSNTSLVVDGRCMAPQFEWLEGATCAQTRFSVHVCALATTAPAAPAVASTVGLVEAASAAMNLAPPWSSVFPPE